MKILSVWEKNELHISSLRRISFRHVALTSPCFEDLTLVLTSIWEAWSHSKNCQVCSRRSHRSALPTILHTLPLMLHRSCNRSAPNPFEGEPPSVC